MWKYPVKSSHLISAVINFHCSRNPSTHSSHEKATATFEIQCCHLSTTTAANFLQFYFVQTWKTSTASTPRHPHLLRAALQNHALAFQSTTVTYLTFLPASSELPPSSSFLYSRQRIVWRTCFRCCVRFVIVLCTCTSLLTTNLLNTDNQVIGTVN